MLKGNCSDLQVVRSNYSAGSFKFSADFSTTPSALIIEGK